MIASSKVAVVTGAASGIGRATCIELLGSGYRIAAVDHDVPALERLSMEIHSSENFAPFPAELGNHNEVQRLVHRILDAFKGIDILVSNAGIQTYGNVVTTSEEDWDLTLTANLKSAFFISKYCLPVMVDGGGGAVIITASVQSLGAQRNSVAYMVSKHALLGLMRSMALDYAKHNIRVNAVCPGAIDTPMLRMAAALDPNPDRVISECNKMHPLGRMGRAEEIAKVIGFLAGDSASFVTGCAMTVDGGLMIPLGGMSFQDFGTGASHL